MADAEPAVTGGETPEPEVSTSASPGETPESLALPETEAAKVSDAPVLAEPAQVRMPEPPGLPEAEILPPGGANPDALLVQGLLVTEAARLQIAPDATVGAEPGAQAVVASTVADALISPIEEGATQTIPSAIDDPAKPVAQSQTTPPQPASRPLRALAERTSKPLEGGSPAAKDSPAPEVKASSSPPPSPAASTEQSVKPAVPLVPTASAAQVESIAPTPEEAPAGGSATAQSEATAAARDHSLSTLSRATVDATAQIAAQILRKLEGRSTRFEIALRPAELGRVDVKLDIDAEGRLNARLAFDNPMAATDLRGRADELRRQLEAAGFQLADDAFEFAERDSGSSAFDRGQDARHGSNRAFAAAARLKDETDVAQPPQWMALSLSPSGVDMKV